MITHELKTHPQGRMNPKTIGTKLTASSPVTVERSDSGIRNHRVRTIDDEFMIGWKMWPWFLSDPLSRQRAFVAFGMDTQSRNVSVAAQFHLSRDKVSRSMRTLPNNKN